MIQFEYDGVMKRYEVKVPQVIAGEHSMLTIAYISEDNRMTLLREMKVEFVRNLLLQWDEYEYQMTRELDGLISEEDREYARWELEHDLAKSIDELEFSTRVHNTMQWLGIKTVGELTKKKACELLKFKSFGRKSLTEVEDKLLGLSLTLKQ
jgi:DNA-directed RNA polymerase alpha subunit|tara:strand:+ start:308 stop:763 length:456 start_codon:yes stop_codon:yes gene_type:complete